MISGSQDMNSLKQEYKTTLQRYAQDFYLELHSLGWNLRSHNRGIKHDFLFINFRKVLREVLKTEGEARGFQPS